ncbi:MAG: TSCPD domain-containing protein, partial [Bacteroidales bacterium]|nr:TSCPD domain-containing protein [Bacteroidales bacterium]
MNYTYEPKGTCSRLIEFELDGEIIKNVKFTGGCHGNTQG